MRRVEDDLSKWTRPPAELHLNQHFAQCTVLYFAPNHDFALIYGTVIKAAKSEGLSHGDGRVVHVGTWSAKDATLAIRYQLVSRTVQKANETLPGPMQTAEVKIRDGTLLFANKRFNRHTRSWTTNCGPLSKVNNHGSLGRDALRAKQHNC